jgi:phage/plasmid-like protein (TIGR03299 family)
MTLVMDRVQNATGLTPIQALDKFGLNWNVEKIPLFARNDEKEIAIKREQALVRTDTNQVLSLVSDTWHPCQNETAFGFFNDFVAAGEMEMEQAGSYHNGKLVYALAKVGESFELPGEDVIDNYFLFVNPHQFGRTIDIRMVPTRLFCGNQIAKILKSASKMAFKFNHRKQFNPDDVKVLMGIASDELRAYKEQAEYLASRRYKDEDVVEYFKRVFPVASDKREISRNAERAIELVETSPGHQASPGSWWNVFNAATYITNHDFGRSEDNRMSSLWMGGNQERNEKALNFALELA